MKLMGLGTLGGPFFMEPVVQFTGSLVAVAVGCWLFARGAKRSEPRSERRALFFACNIAPGVLLPPANSISSWSKPCSSGPISQRQSGQHPPDPA